MGKGRRSTCRRCRSGAGRRVTYAGAALRQPPSGPPMISGSVTLNSLSGLYQITAVAPGGVAAGAAAVKVESVGQTSQAGVTLAVTGSAVNAPVNRFHQHRGRFSGHRAERFHRDLWR